MLSILIPIYNWNCMPLVTVLRQQAQQMDVEYEIVCLDDASVQYKEENRAIASLPCCRYEELPRNVGRSRIRNRLGLEARYDYLLFLDCDAMPTGDDFLRLYLNRATPRRVIVGSVGYGAQKPAKERLLRYRFGKQREEIGAQERMKSPHERFNTFNFLIPRRLLLEIGFDESLGRYGHEDTLLGVELERRSIEVLHIDLPVCHTEIDSNRLFVHKTEQSIENLRSIEQKIGRTEAAAHFRLTRTMHRLAPTLPLIALLFSLVRPLLKQALTTFAPSLLLLDLYKVGYYALLCRHPSGK